MKTTFQILAANIRRRKGSFIGLLILVAIVSLCTVIVVSTNTGGAARLDKSYEETNQPQGWIWVPSDYMNDRLTDDIKALDSVESIASYDSIFTSYVEVNNKKTASMYWLADCPERYHVFDKAGMSFLEHPSRLEKGQCYLPIVSQQKMGAEIGDTVVVKSGDATRYLEIMGFIEEPSRGFLVTMNLGFLSREDLDDLLLEANGQSNYPDLNGAYNAAAVTIIDVYASDNVGTTQDMKRDIDNLDSASKLGCVTLTATEMKGYDLLILQMFAAILGAFALILFVVSLLVIGNSISTGIEMDYQVLGIQKALGFSGARLRLLLVLQYGGAALIGSLLGILAAIPLTPVCAKTFTPIIGLLPTTEIHGLHYVFGLLVSIFLFTLFKSRVITAITPMRAIRGGHAAAHFTSRATMPIIPRALHSSLAARAVTSAPRQYISATIIVVVLSAFLLLMAGLGNWAMSDSMIETLGSKDVDFRVGYTDENQVASVEKTIEEIASIKDNYQLVGLYVLAEDQQVLCSIYSSADDMEPFLVEGHTPHFDNEVVLTPTSADFYNKKVGDTVTIGYHGNKETYVVSGLIQSINDGGNCIALTHDAFGHIDPDDTTASLFLTRYYLLDDRDVATEVIDNLRSVYGDDITVSPRGDIMTFDTNLLTQAIAIVMTCVYIVSLLVGFVASLLTCNRIFLAERMTLGAYRAQGFSSAGLRLQFSLRFLMVAFIGAIIGAVVVFAFGGQALSAVFSQGGITNFDFPLTVTQAIIPTSIIVLFFMLFSFIAARKIKTVDVKELVTE